MATKEEVRKGHIVSTVCGVLCVSMVGGFIYYTNRPEPYPERIVNMEETVDKEYQKIIDNIKITPKEQALIDSNTISETVGDINNNMQNINNTVQEVKENIQTAKENIQNKVGTFIKGITSKISSKTADTENTGFDKNGNPYLKKGASYTFKDDGTPVEAPANGKYAEVVSNVNGKTYAYNNFNQEWDLYILDDVKKQSRAEAMGEINSMGETDLHKLTDEQIDKFHKNMKINLGSMGY